MISIPKTDYNHLRALLLSNCTQYSGSHELEFLKLKYAKEINSIRRLSYVENVKDLIELLEKRGCLSENDISIFEYIAKELNINQFILEVNKRSQHVRAETVGTTSPVINNIADNLMDRIEDLISSELGNKWVYFARALNVRESQLDQLQLKYPDDIPARIRDVLRFHSKNAHPREWKQNLLDALTAARRNDLRKEVESLYVNYT